METTIMRKLFKKIQDRNLRLTVIGSGYVGLPTAALFADAGFNVTAVDMKSKIVESVNRGVSPINESGLQELVLHNVQAGKLACMHALRKNDRRRARMH